MAQQVSNAFVQLFDSEVKQAYQAQRALGGLTRERNGVEGSSVKFPKMGQGSATMRIPQTDVVPMNASYSQVTCTLQDWNAAEYSDIFQQLKINFDERRELVKVVSAAIGRRMDQLLIDSLVASGTSLTVANSIGGASTGLNVAKLRRAKALLDKANVPGEGRTILIHANSLENLLSETAATSADFNSVKALVEGSINSFLGFKFVMIGDRTEGGLPIDGSSDRTCFAFHRDAMGLAVGMQMKSEINYIPEKTSWLVNGMFSAGACTIDATGVVSITTREA